MADSNLDRRQFLQAGALAGVGATLGVGGLSRVAFARTPNKRDVPIKLGLASYSLRKFSRAQMIEMAKSLGVSCVNLKSVHLPYEASAAELEAARKEMEAAGLTIVGGGTITFGKDTDEDVKAYFDYARAAGMPVMVSTCKPEILPRVEKFAKQYDIKVAIHNHGPEDKNFPSPYDVLKAVNGMDPRMGLCMDIGHTFRTGTDIVRAIGDAGPRLLDMHVKDLRDSKARESQCIVGEGAIPIADIFRKLQEIGYTGYANLEYEIDADDPIPGMQRSYAYMRGVIAGLAAAQRKTA